MIWCQKMYRLAAWPVAGWRWASFMVWKGLGRVGMAAGYGLTRGTADIGGGLCGRRERRGQRILAEEEDASVLLGDRHFDFRASGRLGWCASGSVVECFAPDGIP